MRDSLVEQARNGDDRAFEALVDLDSDRCLAIAYRILRDLPMAEDAVQQALFKAWHELPRLRDVDRYERWLQRLLVNQCYLELRRHRRWTDRVTELTIDAATRIDAYAAADDREALDRAFARVPPDRRAVFVLHHYAGVPLAEVAEILGLPLGTVKSRLHYTSDALRAALAADARLGVAEGMGS